MATARTTDWKDQISAVITQLAQPTCDFATTLSAIEALSIPTDHAEKKQFHDEMIRCYNAIDNHDPKLPAADRYYLRQKLHEKSLFRLFVQAIPNIHTNIINALNTGGSKETIKNGIIHQITAHLENVAHMPNRNTYTAAIYLLCQQVDDQPLFTKKQKMDIVGKIQEESDITYPPMLASVLPDDPKHGDGWSHQMAACIEEMRPIAGTAGFDEKLASELSNAISALPKQNDFDGKPDIQTAYQKAIQSLFVEIDFHPGLSPTKKQNLAETLWKTTEAGKVFRIIPTRGVAIDAKIQAVLDALNPNVGTGIYDGELINNIENAIDKLNDPTAYSNALQQLYRHLNQHPALDAAEKTALSNKLIAKVTSGWQLPLTALTTLLREHANGPGAITRADLEAQIGNLLDIPTMATTSNPTAYYNAIQDLYQAIETNNNLSPADRVELREKIYKKTQAAAPPLAAAAAAVSSGGAAAVAPAGGGLTPTGVLAVLMALGQRAAGSGYSYELNDTAITAAIDTLTASAKPSDQRKVGKLLETIDQHPGLTETEKKRYRKTVCQKTGVATAPAFEIKETQRLTGIQRSIRAAHYLIAEGKNDRTFLNSALIDFLTEITNYLPHVDEDDPSSRHRHIALDQRDAYLTQILALYHTIDNLPDMVKDATGAGIAVNKNDLRNALQDKGIVIPAPFVVMAPAILEAWQTKTNDFIKALTPQPNGTYKETFYSDLKKALNGLPNQSEMTNDPEKAFQAKIDSIAQHLQNHPALSQTQRLALIQDLYAKTQATRPTITGATGGSWKEKVNAVIIACAPGSGNVATIQTNINALPEISTLPAADQSDYNTHIQSLYTTLATHPVLTSAEKLLLQRALYDKTRVIQEIPPISSTHTWQPQLQAVVDALKLEDRDRYRYAADIETKIRDAIASLPHYVTDFTDKDLKTAYTTDICRLHRLIALHPRLTADKKRDCLNALATKTGISIPYLDFFDPADQAWQHRHNAVAMALLPDADGRYPADYTTQLSNAINALQPLESGISFAPFYDSIGALYDAIAGHPHLSSAEQTQLRSAVYHYTLLGPADSGAVTYRGSGDEIESALGVLFSHLNPNNHDGAYSKRLSKHSVEEKFKALKQVARIDRSQQNNYIKDLRQIYQAIHNHLHLNPNDKRDLRQALYNKTNVAPVIALISDPPEPESWVESVNQVIRALNPDGYRYSPLIEQWLNTAIANLTRPTDITAEYHTVIETLYEHILHHPGLTKAQKDSATTTLKTKTGIEHTASAGDAVSAADSTEEKFTALKARLSERKKTDYLTAAENTALTRLIGLLPSHKTIPEAERESYTNNLRILHALVATCCPADDAGPAYRKETLHTLINRTTETDQPDTWSDLDTKDAPQIHYLTKDTYYIFTDNAWRVGEAETLTPIVGSEPSAPEKQRASEAIASRTDLSLSTTQLMMAMGWKKIGGGSPKFYIDEYYRDRTETKGMPDYLVLRAAGSPGDIAHVLKYNPKFSNYVLIKDKDTTVVLVPNANPPTLTDNSDSSAAITAQCSKASRFTKTFRQYVDNGLANKERDSVASPRGKVTKRRRHDTKDFDKLCTRHAKRLKTHKQNFAFLADSIANEDTVSHANQNAIQMVINNSKKLCRELQVTLVELTASHQELQQLKHTAPIKKQAKLTQLIEDYAECIDTCTRQIEVYQKNIQKGAKKTRLVDYKPDSGFGELGKTSPTADDKGKKTIEHSRPGTTITTEVREVKDSSTKGIRAHVEFESSSYHSVNPIGPSTDPAAIHTAADVITFARNGACNTAHPVLSASDSQQGHLAHLTMSVYNDRTHVYGQRQGLEDEKIQHSTLKALLKNHERAIPVINNSYSSYFGKKQPQPYLSALQQLIANDSNALTALTNCVERMDSTKTITMKALADNMHKEISKLTVNNSAMHIVSSAPRGGPSRAAGI